MSEPNWRELGDPWADRLPPPPRSEVSFRHAHRLAQTRRMSPVDPQQDDMRCTCGHREEDHAGGNCLQGGLLDACDCYGFQPWIDR